MTTLTPGPVRLRASQEADLHAPWAARLEWAADRLRGRNARELLRRKAVATWMNLLIAAAAAVTVITAGFLAQQHWPDSQTWGAGALKLFALWCLAFLPGWLYVRFLGMRAKALWAEYVLNLHRLGWDRPAHLPEPPLTSEFHAQWEKDQDPRYRNADNIYRQKFEAYYGRQVPDAATGVRRPGNGAAGMASRMVTTRSAASPCFPCSWRPRCSRRAGRRCCGIPGSSPPRPARGMC